MMEEYFDLVNEEGAVVGRASRNECHGNPALIHQAVHVAVFDDGGRLFLQKRSPNKDIQPGKWDTSVGGHLQPGESAEAGARREMLEELGIAPPMLERGYHYLWRSEVETEYITTFFTRHSGPFRLQREEIDEGAFWNPADILQQRNDEFFTPQFRHERFRILSWYEQHASSLID